MRGLLEPHEWITLVYSIVCILCRFVSFRTLAVVVVVQHPRGISAQRPPARDLSAGLRPGAPVRGPVVLVKLQQLHAAANLHLLIGGSGVVVVVDP